MRLYIDTSKAASGFMVSRGFEPKVDITTGRIKTDRATGQELHTIQLTAFDERAAR